MSNHRVAVQASRSSASILESFAVALLVSVGIGLTTAGRATADSVEPGARTCFGVSGAVGDTAVVNLTPVGALASGSGQLVSSDLTSPPVYSNVNFSPGTVDPNVAVAAIGPDGRTCFVNNGTARTGVVADHMGTIAAASYTPATPDGAPERVVDTRIALGGTRLGPDARLCFAVDGTPGDAAVVNLTPVRATGTGDGKLVSSDVTAPPVYSNVNYSAGSIDPNVAIATIGTDGEVCFVNANLATVDLVADHMGTIAAAGYAQATPSGAPVRVVDTRVALAGDRLEPEARLCFAVAGTPGDAAVVNLTPVRAAGRGNGQLVSSDIASPPVYSNVNWDVRSIDPNVAISTIGADGRVCFVNNGWTSVDLVADHMGTVAGAAYKPASPSGAPVRTLDSRLTASRADLVLDQLSVGMASFTLGDAETVRYIGSALGDPTSDTYRSYPVLQSTSPYYETADGLYAFDYLESREVCWDNEFCVTFGGQTVAELAFVGWDQSTADEATAALSTPSGVTIGSRGSDFPDAIWVGGGGCSSYGSGTADEMRVELVSDGVPFGEFGPRGEYIANTPPLSAVTVVGLHGGTSVFHLEEVEVC